MMMKMIAVVSVVVMIVERERVRVRGRKAASAAGRTLVGRRVGGVPLVHKLEELLEAALLHQAEQRRREGLLLAGRHLVHLLLLDDVAAVDRAEVEVLVHVGLDENLDQQAWSETSAPT